MVSGLSDSQSDSDGHRAARGVDWRSGRKRENDDPEQGRTPDRQYPNWEALTTQGGRLPDRANETWWVVQSGVDIDVGNQLTEHQALGEGIDALKNSPERCKSRLNVTPSCTSHIIKDDPEKLRLEGEISQPALLPLAILAHHLR